MPNNIREKKNRLLAALHASDLALLAPHLVEVPLKLGAILQEQGELVRHVYFPHSGMISVLAIMRDGRGVETIAVGNEGMLGGMAGLGQWRASNRAVVQVAGTASQIGASELGGTLAQSSRLKDLVLRSNEVALAQAQQAAACNALHSIEQRLCRWLLHTLDSTDSNIVPLTQELLSQVLGVQRTSVTLAARLLQKRGHVKYRRGVIEIVDRAGLVECACECYEVIRQHLSRLAVQTKRRSAYA
ncbi:MAG: Crp/Fnr family transcriptional regulator [Alphaproteobacteria bacterium]